MSIWFREYTIEQIKPLNIVNMLKHMDLQLEEIGPDFLRGSIPVDERSMQPFGILHGGATVFLAESLGSIAANLVLDPSTSYAVGLDVNCNHLRAMRTGRATGTARPKHIGRSTQVWEIDVVDAGGKLAAVARLTMSVLQR